MKLIECRIRLEESQSPMIANGRRSNLNDRPSSVDIPVYENYNDHEPKINVAKHVASYVRSVPHEYLSGLCSFVLTNELALSTKERKKLWRRNKYREGGHVCGLYHPRTTNQPAWIELFVDNLLRSVPMPALLLRIGIIRDLLIATAVFHEIGHHINMSHRSRSQNLEKEAEKYQDELGRRYILKRYWYLFPILLPISIVYELSQRRKSHAG